LRPGPLRTITVLAKTLATRRIGALLTELLVGKPPRRARIAAVTARRAIVAIEPGTFATGAVAARGIGAFLATVLARPEILARAPIGPIPAPRRTIITIETGGTRRVAIVPARCSAVPLPCVRALVAVAPVGLAGKIAFGELFLWTARLARAAPGLVPAAIRPVAASPRGCIVFVFVAGHE
jgi:hypothetical protein